MVLFIIKEDIDILQIYMLMKGSITDCQIIRISAGILHGSCDCIRIANQCGTMQDIAGHCKEIVEPLKTKVIYKSDKPYRSDS